MYSKDTSVLFPSDNGPPFDNSKVGKKNIFQFESKTSRLLTSNPLITCEVVGAMITAMNVC